MPDAAMLVVLLALGAASALGEDRSPAEPAPREPSAVPTFHCLSLYWSPVGGEAAKQVLVKFREGGAVDWRDGLPMRFNPVASPECKADYRGSVVNLAPGTAYEVELTLEGTDRHASLTARTWAETFPIGATVTCASAATTLAVTTSGTPDGYVLYDGTGCTIDGANAIDLGIAVDASYVILRGFTVRDVAQHGIGILKGDHIVIEGCDVSRWGGTDDGRFGVDMQGAVSSTDHDVHAVVVQRCKLHDPTWSANSWADQHNGGTHPAGPQAIVLWESAGNNVFRYNECWSDREHMFNDVLGGANNASYRGYPGADSDIYGNYVADCWDDGIEAEGGGQNVRIWANCIEDAMVTIANAATSIGPLYVWRNVGGRSSTPIGSAWAMTHGPFMKMGYADGERWMTGHMYVFNNTIFQAHDDGAEGLGAGSRIIKHCVSRNNILASRSGDSHSISTEKKSADNDFDWDLITARVPNGAEAHGVHGVPIYVATAGFTAATRTGDFRQAPDSPGAKRGVVIPNFCDASATPDIGAQDADEAPMVYGVRAEFVPRPPAHRAR